MSCFFAVLDPPSRKGLSVSLAPIIHGGYAGTKLDWDAGHPLLYMCTVHDDDAMEHAEQFEALFEWADAHEISVTIFHSPFPSDGEDIERTDPVDRERFRNAVEMMKSIAEEVAEEMEQEALMSECPCCSSLSIDEADSYEICGVCGWQDDPSQHKHPKLAGGANDMSLEEARLWWARHRERIPPNGPRPQGASNEQ